MVGTTRIAASTDRSIVFARWRHCAPLSGLTHYIVLFHASMAIAANGTSNGLAVCTGLDLVTNTQTHIETDHATRHA